VAVWVLIAEAITRTLSRQRIQGFGLSADIGFMCGGIWSITGVVVGGISTSVRRSDGDVFRVVSRTDDLAPVLSLFIREHVGGR
jgi:hypothetical protein